MNLLLVSYIVQIFLLLVCIYMTCKARKALNGHAFLIAILYAFLIFRRIDDISNHTDNLVVLIISNAVTIIAFIETWRIYQKRELYALYLRNRTERIEELEKMYHKN